MADVQITFKLNVIRL